MMNDEGGKWKVEGVETLTSFIAYSLNPYSL